MSFVTVQEAIEETRTGRMLVVADDEDRENEGDLTLAAEKITPEIIKFHGNAWARPDLPCSYGRPLRLSAPSVDDTA